MSRIFRLTFLLLLFAIPTFYVQAQTTVVVTDAASLINAVNTANTQDTIISFAADITLTTPVNGSANNLSGTPTITRSVTIEGNGHTITRDTNGADLRFFDVNAVDQFTVRNLTLSNGYVNGNSASGGAIKVTDSNVTFTNVNFYNNTTVDYNATGAAVDNRSPGKLMTITGGTISGNNTGASGTIFIYGSLTMSGTTFMNNTTGVYGAGVYVGAYNSGVVNVTNVTFNGNIANGDLGGGITIASSPQVTITNSTFEGNQGSAVYFDRNDAINSVLTITGTTFNENGSPNVGAAIRTDSQTFNIFDSTITGNNGSTGGAIYTGSSDIHIENTNIEDNTSTGNGGAMYAGGFTTIEVINSIVQGNSSNFSGGGFYMNSNNVNAHVSISNTPFYSNSANQSGGGLYNGSNILEIRRSDFGGNGGSNDAGNVGAGLYSSVTNYTLLEDLQIAGNGTTATGNGGGAYIDGALYTNRVSIWGNRARSYGTGLYVTGTLDLLNTTVSGNFDGTRGVYLPSNSLPKRIAFSTIINNNGTDIVTAANSLPFVYASIVGSCNIEVSSGGYNAEPNESCGFTDNSDSQNIPVGIESLADNGGSGQTHDLTGSSPALENVDTADCVWTNPITGNANETVSFDGRGASRPQGSKCDSGAVESGSTPESSDLQIRSLQTTNRADSGVLGITYVIEVDGSVTVGTQYHVGIYHSIDANCTSGDTELLHEQTAIRGLNELEVRTFVELPLADLRARALAADPGGIVAGTQATHIEYLCVLLDTNNVIGESDEDNNSATEDFTYFAWDVDGDNAITPSDTIEGTNRLGYLANLEAIEETLSEPDLSDLPELDETMQAED